MKRLLSLILCFSLIASIFAGCANSSPAEVAVVETANTVTVSTAETPGTDEASEPTSPAEEIPAFTGLSDPSLLTYVEDDIYATLEKQFASDDYIIEEVSASYISQEYLDELAYNSQKNIFFGYTLSDLDAQFSGDRYVFTLGEDGRTAVQKMDVLHDDTYDQILKNVAIGTGVILVCVTVSVASAGLGAPAAVTMVFTAAAKTGATFAASGACLSAASKAIVTGYQTGDVKQALKAAAIGGSEGFKWGAISGSVTGGAGKAIKLHKITSGNKIPTPQAAEQLAQEMYGGKSQVSYLNGKEVNFNTPGATRPDIVRNMHGHLEAIEVKNYNLANASNRAELTHELKRQIAARVRDLPEGSTQRIVLNTQGRGFSKELIDDVVKHLQKALDDVYPDIPIDIMR